MPGIPRQLSFHMESVTSLYSNGIEGLITRTREAYDADARLFMQTMNGRNEILTQLDDYETGLFIGYSMVFFELLNALVFFL